MNFRHVRSILLKCVTAWWIGSYKSRTKYTYCCNIYRWSTTLALVTLLDTALLRLIALLISFCCFYKHGHKESLLSYSGSKKLQRSILLVLLMKMNGSCCCCLRCIIGILYYVLVVATNYALHSLGGNEFVVSSVLGSDPGPPQNRVGVPKNRTNRRLSGI